MGVKVIIDAAGSILREEDVSVEECSMRVEGVL